MKHTSFKTHGNLIKSYKTQTYHLVAKKRRFIFKIQAVPPSQVQGGCPQQSFISCLSFSVTTQDSFVYTEIQHFLT